ncbi:MAG TPA: hypothetical protein VF988_08970 [Verrucomicrobiae bacterium]
MVAAITESDSDGRKLRASNFGFLSDFAIRPSDFPLAAFVHLNPQLPMGGPRAAEPQYIQPVNKNGTSNGVFGAKKKEINIVGLTLFSYYSEIPIERIFASEN